MLRGNKGTKVTVQILRKGLSEILDLLLPVTRSLFIASMRPTWLSHIGYIKLNRFSLTTEEEFLTALSKVKKEKMRGLILDLRGNGGGFLNAAVALSEQFLDENKLVVYTEGEIRHASIFPNQKGNSEKAG